MFKVIWLTGQSGAGKTTLAKALQEEWPSIILDGDEMRKSISVESGYTLMDRAEHNYRVARLASVLAKQTNVIVAVIAPSADVRKEIAQICNPIWVYVKRNLPERDDHPYEEQNDYLTVCPDAMTISEEVISILNFVI